MLWRGVNKKSYIRISVDGSRLHPALKESLAVSQRRNLETRIRSIHFIFSPAPAPAPSPPAGAVPSCWRR